MSQDRTITNKNPHYGKRGGYGNAEPPPVMGVRKQWDVEAFREYNSGVKRAREAYFTAEYNRKMRKKK